MKNDSISITQSVEVLTDKRSPLFHHPKSHSARWTDEYLYNQLIPYIGNKRKLLPLIGKAIHKTGVREGVFLDVFAGSGVVSRLAKILGYGVISNDWEPYTYEINNCFIVCNDAPSFEYFGGMANAFLYLNNLEGKEGYIATYYCPRNDDNPDVKRERMFFMRKNGAKIDAIRDEIETLFEKRAITRLEKSVLLASLVYSTSYVSNTSGVFKGFHCGWGGKTQTALYRIKSDIELIPPILYPSSITSHRVFMEDASALAKALAPVDIAYVDPPYNQHQYGSNYHILNTVVLWDKPKINRDIMINGKVHNKSAIRKDWRKTRRSGYCYRSSAVGEFETLVKNLHARFVLVSYSTDGIMPFETMLDVLKRFGSVDIVHRKYKRYRVSSTRPSARGYNTEFVIILKKDT